MPTVIGLDLSLTAFGVARFSDGHVWTWTIKVDGWSDPFGWAAPARRRRILTELREKIVAPHGDVLAVIEARIPPTRGWQSHLDRAELRGTIEDELYARRIPVARVPVQTLKKYATGDGSADKAAMLRTAREVCGSVLHIADDNQADAFWLMVMGVQQFRVASGPVFSNVNRFSLDRVDWPMWTPAKRGVRA